jgi:2-dehydro-3-deoxyphosphogluconate aldolase/(4S)-4-hydroxy-2-oxoglutarate aldolase
LQVPDAVIGLGTVTSIISRRRSISAPTFSSARHCRRRASAAVSVPAGHRDPVRADGALAAGFSVLKFFPAEPAGGVEMFGAVRPSPKPFCPRVASTPRRRPYLELPNVVAVGALAGAAHGVIARTAKITRPRRRNFAR